MEGIRIKTDFNGVVIDLFKANPLKYFLSFGLETVVTYTGRL